MSPEKLALLVLQNSGDYINVITDPDGTIIGWNPAAERVLGWPAEEALGNRAEMFFSPEDRQAGVAKAEMARAAARGIAVDERWHVRRDGTRFWAVGEMTALRDGGALIGYSKILRDRTREREVEERLRIAQEAGGIGTFESLPARGTVLASAEFCRLWGIPAREEISLDEIFALIYQDDRARVHAWITKPSGGALDYLEHRIVRPDSGEIRWMARRGETMVDEGKSDPRYIGVCYDITERKRIEQNLLFLAQASAELAGLEDLQVTLDKIAFLAVPIFADWCAVDLLQEDGTLERVAVAHADPEKLSHAGDLHRRFPPDPNLPRGIWKVVRTGEAELVSEINAQLLAQLIEDPQRRAIMQALGFKSYIGVPLSARGRTFGAVSFFSAESARKYGMEDLETAVELGRNAAIAIENANLYRALQEADRGKDVFLATLAHELRNPLAAIMNGVSILQLASDDKNRIAHCGRLMERQANQLKRLVDDLLDVSRISAGKIRLKKEPANLAAILAGAVEANRAYIEAAHHELLVKLPGESTELMADPLRLSQVFSNLLNNAAKYTNPGGRIEVIIESSAAEWLVRVKDSGIGIAPSMLKSIFTIFTQVSHSVERSQGGLGIGLSLVDGLVRMHGGRVEAFSAGPEQGSEFVVHLPRNMPDAADPQEEPARVGTDGEKAAAARRILVVDDNVDAANSVTDLLRMLGHDASAVHDGPAAVAAALDSAPDIIIIDIGLPGMDGYEVARRIRAGTGSAKPLLIALTGWGQEQDRQSAFEAGFDAHWTKPVSLEQLREMGKN